MIDPIEIAQFSYEKIDDFYKQKSRVHESIVIDFYMNENAVVGLLFSNTGNRPFTINLIKLESQWIEGLTEMVPSFSKNFLLQQLKFIQEYQETLYPGKISFIPLFHLYYMYKPWIYTPIESEDGLTMSDLDSDLRSRLGAQQQQESNELYERKKKYATLLRKPLTIKYKIQTLSKKIFKKKFYWSYKTVNLYLITRLPLSEFENDLENGKFNQRGLRIL